MFHNSLLKWRKVINWSPDNNLSAKTKWRNDVTQDAVSCHLLSYRKSASFVQIMFTAIKRNLVLKFEQTWFIQIQQISVRIPNDKKGTLSHTFLPFCFSTQIVMRRTVANYAGRQWQKVEYIHNVMMDTLEIGQNFMWNIKKKHSWTFFCVSLISDNANWTFRP